MKTTLFISALWLALAGFFAPPVNTFLKGKVSDSDGQAIVGASVKVQKGTEFVRGTMTDLNGEYKISLDPGTYTLEISYVGFETARFVEVLVTEGKSNIIDASLSNATVLNEVVITSFKVPLIEADNTSGGQTLTSEQIKNLPTRSMEPIVATKPGTTSIDGGAVDLKGSRSKTPAVTADKPAKSATGSDEKKLGHLPAKKSESARPAVYAPTGEAKPKPVDTKPTEILADDIVIVDGRKKRMVVPFDPETYEEKVILIDVEDGSIYDGATPTESETLMGDAGTIEEPAPRAGLLTAGEWNDLHNWNHHWNDLLNDGEIASYENMYGFFARQRFTVMLSNDLGFPLADVIVQMKNAGSLVWEAHTDNIGKAELWAGLFDKAAFSNLTLEAWINGKKHDLGKPKTAKEGFNFHKINAECYAPTNVDIVWAVDATGSMGDEIEYLKTEVLDVIARAKSNNPALSFRMGTTFYRDKGDEYIVKSSNLTSDINSTVDFIKKQFAGGGGDYPEAVHSALEDVVYNQKWSENAIARICFLVLDASPHQDPEVTASIQKSIKEAAKRGIRIVPLAASGIQKDTEFLLKFFGLATNGTYLFLTDHSGIGGKHLEPTSDEYKVEPLNDLFVRIITEYTTIRTCEGKSNIRFADDPQQQPGKTLEATYYPNPAVDQFTLELPFAVQSITLYDSEGKGVRKIEKPQAGVNVIPINDLAAGFYTIRILNNGRMQSGKLMIVKT